MKIKTIPNKIHFAGFDYDIEEVDRLDGRESWGRTQTDIQKIFLEKGLSYEKKVETLIHEMLHIALRHTNGIGDLTEKREEEITRSWSMNIFGILKDNGFLKYE